MKTLIVALFLLQASIAVAEKVNVYDVSSLQDTPVITIAWQKTPFNEVQKYCINHGAAACSIVVDNVCHIFAPDMLQLQYLLGRSFIECITGVTTAKAATVGAPMQTFNYKQVDRHDTNQACKLSKLGEQMHFITDDYSINQHVIGDGGTTLGCIMYGTDMRKYIIVPKIVDFEQDFDQKRTTGHEIKHVFDGYWHTNEGVAKPGVFANE